MTHKMRGNVRLCSTPGCYWPAASCPQHAGRVMFGLVDLGRANAVLPLNDSACACGFLVGHSPTCERGKPRTIEQERGKGKLHCTCPTCGFYSRAPSNYNCAVNPDLIGKSHQEHRAAWLAKPQPSVRAGWHLQPGDDAFRESIDRDDGRATVWKVNQEWQSAKSEGRRPVWARTWSRGGFACSDDAIAYADARLAEEDARKAGELPAGWKLRPTFQFTYDHESGASVSRSIGVEDEWHAHRTDGSVILQTVSTREEAMRLATAHDAEKAR